MHHTILRNELVKCGKKLSDRLVGTMMARPTGVEGGQEKPAPPCQAGRAGFSGGELGIRTPDRIWSYTRLAGEHLRPLGQLSKM